MRMQPHINVNILNLEIAEHKFAPEIVEMQSLELFVSYFKLTIVLIIPNAKIRIPRIVTERII